MTARYEPLTEPGPGEVLLGWLDAEGSGTLELLGRRVTWFGSGRPGDLSPPPKNAYLQWVREMSALAYLDVDLSGRRWSAAPPALVTLPGLGGLLMLAGVRAAYLLEELDRLGFDGFAFRHTPHMGLAIPVPGTLLVQAERQSMLDDLYWHLRTAEPRLVNAGCASSRIASLVPPVITGLLPSAAPVNDPDNPLEKLVVGKLLSDTTGHPEPWVAVAPGTSTPGAYRWRRPGQLIHAVFDGRDWISGDRSNVIHAGLSLHRRSSLRWTPYEDDPLQRGALAVHRYIDLPMMHKRSATLCTGFPARTKDAMRVYEGVPLEIAKVLAESLGQQLNS